jgi:stage IV sporulation protein FB
MFGTVGHTQLDLNFSLFGIPVRIHPLFWLAGALTYWRPDFPHLTVIWIACLFLSILVHEMGHALMARRFGWPIIEVCLHMFGGYCQYDPWRGYTPVRGIQVSLAGPGAGFLLYGLIQLALLAGDQTGHAEEDLPVNVRHAIFYLEQINLFWGLINLLPVLPLDGGHVCRYLLMIWAPRQADDLALKISIVVGALAAVSLFQLGGGGAILFVILTIQNIATLQGRSLF